MKKLVPNTNCDFVTRKKISGLQNNNLYSEPTFSRSIVIFYCIIITEGQSGIVHEAQDTGGYMISCNNVA